MADIRNSFNSGSTRQYYPTYQIRFSPEERNKLETWANGRPIAAYIKDVLFVEERKPQRSTGMILQDHKLFAKALGVLGQSRLSSNINQMAKAVHTGTLMVDEDTEQAIIKAMQAVIWQREMFIRAMGLKPDQGDSQ
ncbi:hypothetical protein AB835_01515 [Candidatus Endobugula sertula]|uniref:Bacterial mobilisation domain-containing protein n=1 Tax=Candidatus Endobugula sertula TaxID=62101 RepID=A0A1D2QTA4_9GAMM|nr:hypothetical protein AB835_01515 [Candidatus Endobugula sertula]